MRKVWFLLILIMVFCCSCDKQENVSLPSTEGETPKKEETKTEEDVQDKNLIHDAIVSQKEIAAKDMYIDKLILRVYSDGKRVLTKEGNFYYWYELDGEAYIESGKIEEKDKRKEFVVFSTNYDEYKERIVNVSLSENASFLRLVNAIGDRAVIQAPLENQGGNNNFKIDLLSGTTVPITYIDRLNSDEKSMNLGETVILLPNDITLCHFFIWGGNADDSSSIWILFDKEDNEIKRFSTRYFDDIDNICVDDDGKYVCFTYGQTTSRPQLLSIEEESITPIFSEDDYFGLEAVLSMNWVNKDTLAVGYWKDDNRIIKFQKVLFE